MDRPEIVVNDPKVGVPMALIGVGQFFRFPASGEGRVYVMVERYHLPVDTDAPPGLTLDRGELAHVKYVLLSTGESYTTAVADAKKRVHPLKLVRAEFELDEERS